MVIKQYASTQPLVARGRAAEQVEEEEAVAFVKAGLLFLVTTW